MSVSTTNEQKSQAAQNRVQAQITRVFVVLNPVAGLTNAVDARQTIETFCRERGWGCEIHETSKDEDLRQLVRDRIKQGVDFVIAAGGDGTVSEVVSGMVDSKVPMGILPAGTGNNLARDLNIPIDLRGALDLLGGEHDVESMDVMEVNGKKFFVLNVSVGISSLTMRQTKRQEKRRFGMLAYFYRAIGSIRNSRMQRFRVSVDNKPLRFYATEVMIANHKFMGLQPQFEGVEVDPDDGKLDLFVVRAQTFREFLSVLLGFIKTRKEEDDPHVNYFEARNSIHIQSEFPLPAQADGEVIGTTPVKVRLLPDSLRVIVPVTGKDRKDEKARNKDS